MTYEF